MCTLIVALGIDPLRPLIVGANRDEQRGRPAEGPAPRRLGGVPCFAPLDVERGGTWMGLGTEGLFVALTNRFGGAFPERRSRGEIVVAALAQEKVKAARSWAEALRGPDERGFHLVVADREGGFVVVADGTSIRIESLLPGEVLIVTERAYDAAPSQRQQQLEARFAHATPEDLTPERLRVVLASQDHGPFDSVNVDVPDMNYGTRSSALVALPAEGSPEWSGTEGPPHEADWQRYEVRFPD